MDTTTLYTTVHNIVTDMICISCQSLYCVQCSGIYRHGHHYTVHNIVTDMICISCQSLYCVQCSGIHAYHVSHYIVYSVVVSMSIYGLVEYRGRECVYAQPSRMISPVGFHDKNLLECDGFWESYYNYKEIIISD